MCSRADGEFVWSGGCRTCWACPCTADWCACAARAHWRGARPREGPCLQCSIHYSAKLLACSLGTAHRSPTQLEPYTTGALLSALPGLKIAGPSVLQYRQLTSKLMCDIAHMWCSSRGPGRGKLADISGWLAQASPLSIIVLACIPVSDAVVFVEYVLARQPLTEWPPTVPGTGAMVGPSRTGPATPHSSISSYTTIFVPVKGMRCS